MMQQPDKLAYSNNKTKEISMKQSKVDQIITI